MGRSYGMSANQINPLPSSHQGSSVLMVVPSEAALSMQGLRFGDEGLSSRIVACQMTGEFHGRCVETWLV